MDRTQQHRHQLGTARRRTDRSHITCNCTTNRQHAAIVGLWALMFALLLICEAI